MLNFPTIARESDNLSDMGLEAKLWTGVAAVGKMTGQPLCAGGCLKSICLCNSAI